LKASKELPKPVAPKSEDYMDTEEGDGNGKGKEAEKPKTKSDIEKNLKGLLRLGKK
jgi:hypothetical protein